jgi:hypothetical protein
MGQSTTRIFDPGDQLRSNPGTVAKTYGIKEVYTEKGKGEFVGESDTREGARRKFDAIGTDYEKRYPGRQHYQDRPNDYYNRLAQAALAARGRPLTERAKQLRRETADC